MMKKDMSKSNPIPPDRLIYLMRQAVSYQIESCEYHQKVAPKVKRYLDFSSFKNTCSF